MPDERGQAGDGGVLGARVVPLLRAGDARGAAAVLAAARWQELAGEGHRLDAALAALPDAALAASPRALLQIARAAEAAVRFGLRAAALERLERLGPSGDVLLELRAEQAVDLARTDDVAGTVALADEVSPAAGAGPLARARAQLGAGRSLAFARDAPSLVRAEDRLAEAEVLFSVLDEPEWRAAALGVLSYQVCFARGDLERAALHGSEAVECSPPGSGQRAAQLTFLADVEAYVGRLDAAERHAEEALAAGRALADHRVLAYAAWVQARIASLRGDGPRTLERLALAERHPGDWFEHPTGIEFLGEAAEMLSRLGLDGDARRRAERAAARAGAIGHPEIAWFAAGVIEARTGDPARAEELLARYSGSEQEPFRDTWRTALARAHAARRRGDPAASSFAARALEGVAALGFPDLPRLHEPDLAASAGEVLAGEAGPAGPATTVRLLGGFSVARRGERVEPPPGHASALVKLAALRPGLGADEAIEELWPGSDPTTGRRRLRNLLNRLRTDCGDLVVREGESLALRAEVDAAAFGRDAAAALEAAPADRTALARAALASYRGDLLPGDRYAEWAAVPRERLRRVALALVDVLVEDARERDDLDGAVHLLDRAIALEPLDDGRALTCAELLLQMGRRGGARALIERVAAQRAELGLPESARLHRLRTSVGRAPDA